MFKRRARRTSKTIEEKYNRTEKKRKGEEGNERKMKKDKRK